MQEKLPNRLQKAYEKLVGNINLEATRVSQKSDLGNIFLIEGRMMENSIVWEFKVKRSDMKDTYRIVRLTQV